MCNHDCLNGRRRFLVAATSTLGSLFVAATAYPFIASMEPSQKALAEGGVSVDFNLGNLAEGELRTLEWHGKPIWILRRSPAMLENLDRHDELLADPSSIEPQQPPYCQNSTRSIRRNIFVAIGICTHLGCIPILRVGEVSAELGSNWPGGFYCPCHGSKYDLAGRVFKNVPAPLNLEVPPHYYTDETHLVIGEDRPA